MQAESVIDEPSSSRQERRDPFVAPEVSRNLRRSSVRGASLMSFSRVTGIGLRFNPIIALRLDFGYRVTRADEPPKPGDRFAFHFSLGQAF